MQARLSNLKGDTSKGTTASQEEVVSQVLLRALPGNDDESEEASANEDEEEEEEEEEIGLLIASELQTSGLRPVMKFSAWMKTFLKLTARARANMFNTSWLQYVGKKGFYNTTCNWQGHA